MEFVSPAGEQRYAAVVRAASEAVVGLDMDGTLSPIVDDPKSARIHPDAGAVLAGLADCVRLVAIITGRPARQAVDLGDLDALGDRLDVAGRELHLFGQYGEERWSSRTRTFDSPRPPAGLGGFMDDLPAVLRQAGAPDAWVEEKGLGVAVHTRRLPDAAAALTRLKEPISSLARSHGLAVEPGRNVIEVRSPHTDKGDAVRTVAAEQEAGAFLFAGDDLGDVAAFEAVHGLSEHGVATLTVCSTSAEEHALRDLADVVVPGPDGVLALLRRLTADVGATRRAQPE